MIKSAHHSFLLISLLYIVLGMVLLVWPGEFLTWGCYALGAIVMLYGISRIIAYMANKNMVSYFHADLIVGIIVTAIGVFLLVRPGVFISILPIVFGFFIIFNGIVKLQDAFELKRLEYQKWWSVFMTAGVSVLLGLVIIWNPFETAALTARVIGIVLIIEGVSSAGTTIFSWHTIKHLSKVLNQTKETVKDVDSVIVEEEDL